MIHGRGLAILHSLNCNNFVEMPITPPNFLLFISLMTIIIFGKIQVLYLFTSLFILLFKKGDTGIIGKYTISLLSHFCKPNKHT